MEDQPAESGDLTTERSEQAGPENSAKPRTPVGKGRRVAAGEAEDAAVDGESDEVPIDSDEATDSEESAEPEDEHAETIMVPFRPAGKRLTYVAAGAAVLFVAAGAFAGAMVQPYLADQALVATKLKVAETSADAITTLWTYTPDNIDSLPQRASQYLSGDFAAQYRTFVDSIVPTNKQAQVSSNTQVMGTAVETIGPDEATVIVYTNSVSTSPITKNIPSLRYLSYRLTLKRDGGAWRITQMPALTKLDLSPQL